MIKNIVNVLSASVLKILLVMCIPIAMLVITGNMNRVIDNLVQLKIAMDRLQGLGF